MITAAQNPVWVFGICTPLSQTFPTSYTAVFTHNHSRILLFDGMPVTNLLINQNDTMPFKFSVLDFSKDIYVIVTSLSGDADVVASFVPFGGSGAINPSCYLDPSNQFHEICTNVTWHGTMAGSDTLHIAAGDPAYTGES
jgi:hypothetical protein